MNWTNDDGSTSVGIWEDFKFKPEEPKEEKPVETVEKPVETKKKTKKK